jgi:Yip1 domain
MDPLPPIAESPSPANGAGMSFAARIANVFATPGDVFEGVKASPVSTANWLGPALILIFVGWLGTVLIFSQQTINAQMVEMAAQSIEKQVERGKLTKEQGENAMRVTEKWATVGAKIGAAVMPVFIGFVSPFWWGLLLWLAGAKVMKGGFSFMKAVEVSGLANMIGVLGEVVRVLLVVSLGSILASPSLALMLKDADPQKPVFTVLSALNLFLLWELGVRSVGLSKLANVSFGKAAIWVYGFWVAFMAFLIGLGQVARLASGG